MPHLIAIAYPDAPHAAGVVTTLRQNAAELGLDGHSLAWVDRDAGGTVHIHQPSHATLEGAIGGALLGLVAGMIFLAPLAGAAAGAVGGAIGGATLPGGVDKRVAADLARQLQPGHAAVLLLLPRDNAEAVLPRIAVYGGTIMQSDFSTDHQRALQASLGPAA